jgi:hypothetical protein
MDNNAFNEFVNNFNNNSDDDSGLIFGAVIIIIAIILVVVVLVLKSKVDENTRKGMGTGPDARAAAAAAAAATAAAVPLPTVPVTYGSIFGSDSSASDPEPQQQAAAIIAADPAQLNGLQLFLNGIPAMLTSEATYIQLIADLIVNGSDSMLAQLFKGMYNKLATVPEFVNQVRTSSAKLWAKRTSKGALLGKYKSMSMMNRARMGLKWMKESARLGESTSARLTSEVGAVKASEFIAAGGRSAAAAARSAASLGVGLVSSLANPLDIAMIVGMTLDVQNVGNYAALSTTNDLIAARNEEQQKTYQTTIDCSSEPVGPSCPPSSQAPPPADTPAPEPRVGRWPLFQGPHDLVRPELVDDSIQSLIYGMIGNPGAPSGEFKKTIDLLDALPASNEVTLVKTGLANLFNSINYMTGSNVRFQQVPFIWACRDSQNIINNSIIGLSTTQGADYVVARLKILQAMQIAISDYIVEVFHTGTNVPSGALLTLLQATFTPELVDAFITAYLDQDCIDKGGLIFNPGPGWDSHTCTWATKEDCHGAYPWIGPDGEVVDGLTDNTTNLLCMTTCPAPCPDGEPCPPPVPCPAPAPCPALNNPDELDLTYTEWRSKNWFSRTDIINTGSGGEAWNSQLNKSAIPSGGACIAGMAGMHQFCDDKQIVGLCEGNNPRANNVYIRDTGTCVNSEQLCQIKGVGFRDNEVTDGGRQYPSCVDTQGVASQALFGSTIARAVNSGTQVCIAYDAIDHVETGSAALNNLANGLIDGTNAVAQAGITAAEALANTGLELSAGLAITTDALVNTGQQVALYAAGSQSGALASALGGGTYGDYLEQNAGAGYLPSFLQAGGTFGDIPQPTPVATTGQPPWNNQAPPTPPGVSSTVLSTDGGAMMHDPIFNTNSCPTGSTVVTNNYCAVCPSGYILSSDGSRCYQCPANFTWGGDATGCVNNSTPPISTNASNSARIGESPTSYGTCPSGTTTIDMGRWTAPLCLSCQSGSTLSQTATGWTCLSCPAGNNLSSDKSVCIRDPNYTPPPPDPLAWTLTGGYTADNPSDVPGYTRIDAVRAPATSTYRIATGSGVSKTTDCAAACNANPACAGFNYRFDPPANTCTLVNSVATTQPYTTRYASLFKKNT